MNNSCLLSGGNSAAVRPPPPSDWPIRFDETTLWPSEPGLRFNPSIIADGDGYLFAVRNKWWGSDILVGRLDASFRPIDHPNRLELGHADADTGRDDPRLFRRRGRPHVSFTGTARGVRAPTHNQLYARLSEDGMQVEELFAPHFPARQRWEKNWSFFEHADDLYAVYSFTPCRILRIQGNTATVAHETPTASIWQGGEIRGGAAPVRVGDELWCFTHDRILEGARLTYRTGLVTLDGAPPFTVRRMIGVPILSGDARSKPKGQNASVVFAGGAVRRDNVLVNNGAQYAELELLGFVMPGGGG